ncbi:MAG: hypothetical protein IIA67_06375 [Planctomycetes bacterium]|nr:hypothetical protein [Planctomycetota bacterium]
MSNVLTQTKYHTLLARYVRDGDELHLLAAADLGHDLLHRGVPIEEVAELHAVAAARLADELPEMTLGEGCPRLAAPLMEMLMSYGLALREREASRRGALQALREREEQLTSQYRGIPVPTYTWKREAEDFVLLDFNDAAERVSQGAVSELRGMPLENVHPDSSEIAADVRQCFLQRSTIQRELPCRLPAAGVETIAEASCVFIPPDLVMVHLADIGDRKRAEEKIRQHQEELAHVTRLSTMGEVAAELAHEINQPLFAIANYAQACSRFLRSSDPQSAAEVAECVEHITGQVQRAGTITRRLSEFISKRSPERSKVAIDDLVRCGGMLVEPEGRSQGVKLTYRLDARGIYVQADAVQIEQVVINLIKNAFEATDELQPHRREVVVSTARCNGEVEVSVVDRGVGVSAANRKRLFEPFFTTKPNGMGMGLAICRTIVRDHGGHLVAIDNPPRGTIFRFRLPILSED